MEETLKKRLIGAAILVIAAAIFLPMFLAGPPPAEQGTQTLSLDIPPSPDRDMSEVRLPLAQGAADRLDPDTITPLELPPRADAPEGADEGAGGEVAATEPAVAAVPQPEPTPPPAAPTSSGPARTAPPPPTASAGTAPRQQAPATSAGGRFWVGLGSYSQSANADRVVNAARGRGIPVQRENVTRDGRTLVRLRAGPWATRAQAEQARQLLIAAVPDARPTVEESEGAPATDAPAGAAAGAWAVQVGAFSDQANANQLRDHLRQAGYPAFIERRGQGWAVRVGPYVRRTEAEAQKQKLKSQQRLDGLIVAHGS